MLKALFASIKKYFNELFFGYPIPTNSTLYKAQYGDLDADYVPLVAVVECEDGKLSLEYAEPEQVEQVEPVAKKVPAKKKPAAKKAAPTKLVVKKVTPKKTTPKKPKKS